MKHRVKYFNKIILAYVSHLQYTASPHLTLLRSSATLSEMTYIETDFPDTNKS